MCAPGLMITPDPDPILRIQLWRLELQPVRVYERSLSVSLQRKCLLYLHVSAFESLRSCVKVLLIGSQSRGTPL